MASATAHLRRLLLLLAGRAAVSTLDAEQVHVSVTSEASVTVSWASPTGQVAEVMLEETASYGIVPNTRRVVRPTVTSYRLKCGVLYAFPCRVTAAYESPLLLHASVVTAPATSYRYQIGVGDEWGRWRYFQTPPAPGARALRIAVVGDLGQTNFSAQTCSDLARVHATEPFDVAVLVGDLAYADTDAGRWDTFGRLFDEAGCSDVVWLVMPGNHEIDPDDFSGESFIPYRQRWRTPEAAPEQVGNDSLVIDWKRYDLRVRYDFGASFYAVRLGSAHLIVLNPYTSADESSPQIQWLKRELLRINRTITPHVLVFTHAPWHHSSVSHRVEHEEATLRLKSSAEKLLLDAKVDMFFSGHVHAYERMHPIDGVRHFLVGHGGNYEELYDDWCETSCSAFRSGDHYGWGALHLQPNQSVWRARRSSDGAVVDSVVFEAWSSGSDEAQPANCGCEERAPMLASGHGRNSVAPLVVGVVLSCAVGCIAIACMRWHRRQARTGARPANAGPDERAELKLEPAMLGNRE